MAAPVQILNLPLLVNQLKVTNLLPVPPLLYYFNYLFIYYCAVVPPRARWAPNPSQQNLEFAGRPGLQLRPL